MTGEYFVDFRRNKRIHTLKQMPKGEVLVGIPEAAQRIEGKPRSNKAFFLGTDALPKGEETLPKMKIKKPENHRFPAFVAHPGIEPEFPA